MLDEFYRMVKTAAIWLSCGVYDQTVLIYRSFGLLFPIFGRIHSLSLVVNACHRHETLRKDIMNLEIATNTAKHPNNNKNNNKWEKVISKQIPMNTSRTLLKSLVDSNWQSAYSRNKIKAKNRKKTEWGRNTWRRKTQEKFAHERLAGKRIQLLLISSTLFCWVNIAWARHLNEHVSPCFCLIAVAYKTN